MCTSLLLAIFWDVSPDLFTLELFDTPVHLTWYGLFFAASFVIGQQLLLHLLKEENTPASDMEMLTLYMAIAIVTGARLGHYLFYEWELLISQPADWLVSILLPPFRGLASHGATIAMLLALYLYSRRRKEQPFLWVADRIVIPGALGGALIRLGNLMNSEIYGVPTGLPWGFIFVEETDPRLLPLTARHPTQLYESLFCVFLFALTFYLWKNKRYTLPAGFITAIFIVLLFSFRFMVEFLKNDQSAFEAGMQLNMGQLLSIPAVTGGLIILFIVRAKTALWKA